MYIKCYEIEWHRVPFLSFQYPSIMPVSTSLTTEISYHKLAHLECYNTAILPFFTSYWHDFTLFIKDLITMCYSLKVCIPNTFQYDQVLQILKAATIILGNFRLVILRLLQVMSQHQRSLVHDGLRSKQESYWINISRRKGTYNLPNVF